MDWTGAGLAVNPSWEVKTVSALAASWVTSAMVAGILDGGGSFRDTSRKDIVVNLGSIRGAAATLEHKEEDICFLKWTLK